MNEQTEAEATEALRRAYAAAPKHPVPCPACKQDAGEGLPCRDRHKLGLGFRLCAHCCLLYLSPRPEAAWYADFYARHYWPVYIGSRFDGQEDLYVKDRCAERAAEIWNGIAPVLPGAPARYLDVGTGQGGMLAEGQRKFPKMTMVGIEPSEAGAAFAAGRNLPVRRADWLALDDASIGGPFDLITMVHVVEHALDPAAFVEKGARHLAPGGRMYVEVPDLGSPHWAGASFFHVAHTVYFAEASLRRLFARCGLVPEAVFHGLAEIWPWGIGILGRKAAEHETGAMPWAPKGEFESLKAQILEKFGAKQAPPAGSLHRAAQAVWRWLRPGGKKS